MRGYRCGGGSGVLGIILMVTGLLLLVLSLPFWLWVSVLGLILIVVGFLIWRFC